MNELNIVYQVKHQARLALAAQREDGTVRVVQLERRAGRSGWFQKGIVELPAQTERSTIEQWARAWVNGPL